MLILKEEIDGGNDDVNIISDDGAVEFTLYECLCCGEIFSETDDLEKHHETHTNKDGSKKVRSFLSNYSLFDNLGAGTVYKYFMNILNNFTCSIGVTVQ